MTDEWLKIGQGKNLRRLQIEINLSLADFCRLQAKYDSLINNRIGIQESNLEVILRQVMQKYKSRRPALLYANTEKVNWSYRFQHFHLKRKAQSSGFIYELKCFIKSNFLLPNPTTKIN